MEKRGQLSFNWKFALGSVLIISGAWLFIQDNTNYKIIGIIFIGAGIGLITGRL